MDWSHRFNDTFTYQTPVGFSDGDYTFSAQATAKGRAELIHRIRGGIGGEEQLSTHEIATHTDVPEGSLVWLPGTNTADIAEAHSVLRQDRADILYAGYALYILTLGR